MKIRIALTVLILFIINGFGICQSTITFELDEVPEEENQKIGIRGSQAPLDWSRSIELIQSEGKYSVDLEFGASENILEFKFVLFTDDENPDWEQTQNRTITLPTDGQKVISFNTWNTEQVIDITSLGKISSAELLQDFELIKTVILEVHPGTYRYNTEKEIEDALIELKSTFSKALTYQEAYLAISKMMAQVKCDHTKAGFNNQNKLINSIIHRQKDKVPFTFKWVDDEMILIHNASKVEELEKGTKIHSMNHVPVIDIRNKMIKYIGADGATDKNRIYKTQVNGYDFRYNAFDVFYSLMYPIKNESLELIVEYPNEKTNDTILVKTLNREQRSKNLSDRYDDFPKSKDDLWSFDLLSDSVAMLKLNSFGLNGWKAITIDYKVFLADAFKQINELEIAHLIIDIRENIGGNDEIASELFSYLSKSTYNFDREGRTRYLNFPENLKPYIKSWGDDPWYYNLNPKIKSPKNGYYIFKDNFKQKPKQSDKKIYLGDSYLLTSSANTSLAFYTAYRFKLQQIGLLVGQETGGNLNDINGGQILFLKLPNSEIEIDFPVMGGFSNKTQADQGVISDIKVEYKISDYIESRDLEVEEVLKLVRKTK